MTALPKPRRLLRCPDVSSAIGLRKTAIYDRVKSGLLPPPVKLGERSAVWPEDEIAACNDAVIRGASNDEIRALVSGLVRARAGV